MFILQTAKNAEIQPSSEMWNAALSGALEMGNIAEAVSLKAEMDELNVSISQHVGELFKASAQIIELSPDIVKIHQNIEKKRKRKRANTAPARPANLWSTMEEISNRSALMALE